MSSTRSSSSLSSSTTTTTTTTRSYWKGAIIHYPGNNLDPSHVSDVERLAQTLLHGNIRSAQLEKLYGSGAWCVRASQANRILFTTVQIEGEAHLLFLECIDNHKYDKAKMQTVHDVDVRKQRVLGTHQTNPEQIKVTMCGDVAAAVEIDDVEVMTHYRRQFIVLDDTQESVLTRPMPQIVNGAAGSGKSCLALARLLNHVTQYPDATDKLLYITRSKRLAKNMREIWDNSLEVPVNCKATVEFLDYETYIHDRYANLIQNKTFVDRKNFDAWFKSKKIKIGIDALTLYQEFQSMAVCQSLDEYKKLGRKKSLIPDDKKQAAFACYQRYMKHLVDGEKVDLKFLHIDDMEAEHHLVVVDEAQDFSPIELGVLSRLAYADQHCFFMDTNQSLLENISVRPGLVEELRAKAEVPLTQSDLKTSYRCAKDVLAFANAVLRVKNVVLGGKADKFEYTQSTGDAGQAQGAVRWVGLAGGRSKKDIKLLAPLKSLASNNPNCAVIVADESMIDEAQQRFSGAIVLTVAQVKGLEFDEIILYKMMQQPEFSEMDERVQDVDARQLKNGMPKDQSTLAYNCAFTKVFTAVTRAISNCYVIEQNNHKRRNMQAYLRSKASQAPAVVSTEQARPATRAEWKEAARKLLAADGDTDEQVRRILVHHLDVKEAVAEHAVTRSALADLLDPKSKPVKNGNEKQVASSSTVSSAKAPGKEKVVATGDNKQQAKKTKADVLSSFAERLVRNFTLQNLEKFLGIKEKSFWKTLNVNMPSYENVKLFVYLRSNVKRLFANPELLHALLRYENGRSFLRALMVQVGKERINGGNPNFAFPYHNFLYVPSGKTKDSRKALPTLALFAEAGELVAFMGEMLFQHTAEFAPPTGASSAVSLAGPVTLETRALYQALTFKYKRESDGSITNSLYEFLSNREKLCYQPRRIIITLLPFHPSLSRLFTYSDLAFAPMFVDGKQLDVRVLDLLLCEQTTRATFTTMAVLSPSVLSGLCTNDLVNLEVCRRDPTYVPALSRLANCDTSVAILDYFWDKKPSLLKRLTAEQLTVCFSVARNSERPLSSLACTLSRTKIGRVTLQRLINAKPGIARDLRAEDLTERFLVQDGGANALSLFGVLCRYEDEIGLLATIFSVNPAIIDGLTANQLAVQRASRTPTGTYINLNALYFLCVGKKPLRLLSRMIELNPGLITEMPSKALALQLDAPNLRDVHATSPFSLIVSFRKAGAELMLEMLALNQRLADSITAELLATIIYARCDGELKPTSSMVVLSATEKGAILVNRLLEFNPSILTKMTVQHLLGPTSDNLDVAFCPMNGFSRTQAGKNLIRYMRDRRPELIEHASGAYLVAAAKDRAKGRASVMNSSGLYAAASTAAARANSQAAASSSASGPSGGRRQSSRS